MDTDKSVFIEAIIFCCCGEGIDKEINKDIEDKLKNFSISKLGNIIKKLYTVSEPLRMSLLHNIINDVPLEKINIQSPNELLRNKSIYLVKQACDIIDCWHSLRRVFIRKIIEKHKLDIHSIKRLSFFIRVMEDKVDNVIIDPVTFNIKLLKESEKTIINSRIELYEKHLNNLIDFSQIPLRGTK